MYELIVERLFRCRGLILDSAHAAYPDGHHGDILINWRQFYTDPALVSEVAVSMARAFVEEPTDVVVSLNADKALADGIARRLTELQSRRVFCCSLAEIPLIVDMNDKEVLLVIDTLFGQLPAAKQLLKYAQCNAYAVATLWNAGGITADQLNVSVIKSFFSLPPQKRWSPVTCPKCTGNIPLSCMPPIMLS